MLLFIILIVHIVKYIPQQKKRLPQRKTHKTYENYIYELFIISQYKTRNEFRKNHQPEFSGEF